MDPRLVERLSLWHKQIEVLEDVEQLYFSLESQEDSLWSQLFLKAEAKSISEREALAYASDTWQEFQQGLVASKVKYNREKRELALKEAAFQAVYLHSKHESEAVQRFPKAMT